MNYRFSRQEYWNRLPSPSPGDLPNPGIKPVSLTSPALAGGFFTTSAIILDTIIILDTHLLTCPVPAFLWVKLLYFFQYLDYQVSRKRRGLYHIYFQHQEIIFESWTVNLSGWSLRTVKGPSSAHSSRFPQRQSVLLLSCQRRRKPLLAVRPGPRLHDS